MAPFIMKKGGGMGVQRRQEREGERENERRTLQYSAIPASRRFISEQKLNNYRWKKVPIKSADSTEVKMKSNSANPVGLSLLCTI